MRRAGLDAEAVVDLDRRQFNARLLGDPVNGRLGRVVGYDWGAMGRIEQPGVPFRFGPEPLAPPRLLIPGLGEHSEQVLAAIGLDAGDIANLLAAGTVRGGAGQVNHSSDGSSRSSAVPGKPPS
jgi:hypothetical protein